MNELIASMSEEEDGQTFQVTGIEYSNEMTYSEDLITSA